jgi:hypothetical protein
MFPLEEGHLECFGGWLSWAFLLLPKWWHNWIIINALDWPAFWSPQIYSTDVSGYKTENPNFGKFSLVGGN